MKLSTPFAHFAPQVELAGLTPVKQSDSIYFVKVGSVKVEFNCNSGTFKVIAGAPLAAITDALSDWTIVSRNKGWTVIAIPALGVSGSSEIVASFIRLAHEVGSVTPLKAKAEKVAKAPKQKTVKMSSILKVVGKNFSEKQAIRARNLELMKKVSARLKGDEQEALPSFDSFEEQGERLDLRELGVM
jgi:hypothetical protein